MQLIDLMVKVSFGNPGAANALAELINVKLTGVNPVESIQMMDILDIKGTDVYILYNDKCQRDAVKLCALIEATIRGKISLQRLTDLSKDQMHEANLTEQEEEIIKLFLKDKAQITQQKGH